MALLWHDGFDRYSVINDLQLKADRLDATASDIAYSTTAGAFGGGTLIGVDDQQLGTFRGWYEVTVPRVETPNDFFCGFWFKPEQFIRRPFVKFSPSYKASGNNDPVFQLGLANSGGLVFSTAGGVARNFSADPPDLIQEGKWSWVEIRARPTDVTGQVEIRINGTTVINETSIDWASGQSQDVARVDFFGGGTSNQEYFFDDIIIYDSTGSDGFTTWLGPRRIYTLSPNGAGLTTNGTPVGVANNWDAVNDTGAYDSGTYVNIGTTTNLDLYTYENLPEAVTDIDAVLVSTVARTDGATPRQIRALARENVTTGNGTTRNVNFGTDADYHLQVENFNTNPDTALAWTDTEVNAAQFGWELVT
jgi:hypothetical protein